MDVEKVLKTFAQKPTSEKPNGQAETSETIRNQKTKGHPIGHHANGLHEPKEETAAAIRTYKRLMKSPILGEVQLIFNQDKSNSAIVSGVTYFIDELADLISRRLSHEALRKIHQVKSEFEGQVVLAKEAKDVEPISRW